MIKQKTIRIAVLALAVMVLMRLVAASGLLGSIDNLYSDLWHRLAGVRYTPEHVVLIAIDEATLDRLRDDPLVFWTPHIARASAVLREAGVELIGLDMMFTISPEQWLRKQLITPDPTVATFDTPLRNEIASGQLLMIASVMHGADGFDEFLLPVADHLLAVPDFDMTRHIGIADLLSDSDGVVRHFSTAPELHQRPGASSDYMPSLSLAALLAVRASSGDPAAGGWNFDTTHVARSAEPQHIGYAGPPGTIPHVPLYRLLEEGAAEDPQIRALKGKIAIIGAAYSGMNDVHTTPYTTRLLGRGGSFMSGPEIHANIIETLLSGRALHTAAPMAATLYPLAAILAALFAFLTLRPLAGLGMLLAALAAVALVAYTAFGFDLLLPVTELQFGLIALYLGVLGLKHASEERERERITQVFGRYVSDNVVDQLIRSGGHPVLGGVTEHVTVLFSDIRNFTTISERLDAQEVVEMLNTYFERVCQAVLDEGGTIDKFIGDAIMVQFGAPVAFDDHADRALRSALVMRGIAEAFRGWMEQRFPDRELPPFAIGIGLHSGDAVIGNIGSQSRLEYTAIGDTVNAASRIEGKTKELGCTILASSATIESARGHVVTGKSQVVSVKGKAESLELFEVLGIETNPPEGADVHQP